MIEAVALLTVVIGLLAMAWGCIVGLGAMMADIHGGFRNIHRVGDQDV